MAIGDKNIAGQNFWLNFAAESIYNTFEKRGKSIEKIQSLISWGLGLFSTGGILLFFFPKTAAFAPVTVFMLAVSVCFMIAGYFFSTKAGLPNPSSYHPLDVEDIMDAFNKAVITGNKAFRASVILTFIGLAGISFSLIIHTSSPFWRKDSDPGFTGEISFHAALHVRNDTTHIPVSITYARYRVAGLTICGYKTDPSKKNNIRPQFMRTEFLATDSLGRCYTSHFCVSDSLKFFTVSVSASRESSSGVTVDQTVTKMLKRE